jgi:hypothetical protein
MPAAAQHPAGRRLVSQRHRDLGPVDQSLHLTDRVVGRIQSRQCAVEDPGRLAVIAAGVGLYNGILQGCGQAAGGSGAGVDAVVHLAEMRIQLPPASMTLKPVTPSLFLLGRGRVIRGMPETCTLPYSARIPLAKAR